MNQQPQQQQIQVNLNDATKQECECGADRFKLEFEIYVISALMSPTGKEMPVEVPKMMCTGCGEQFIHGAKKEVSDV